MNTTAATRTPALRYAVQYTLRDLNVPALQRVEMLQGRDRNGREAIVMFDTRAAVENAASVQRAQPHVLHAAVVNVVQR